MAAAETNGRSGLPAASLAEVSSEKPPWASQARNFPAYFPLVMRPVPKANVVIPYSISVPTSIGTATLTSEKVDITMPDQQRIALRR